VSLDLADLAAAAVEFYAPAAELKNIRLTLHSPGPLAVSGDPVLLAQALGNLIDNALKYAPDEGLIEVTIRRRTDALAEIAVTDNGPGILDAEKTKVVERFYRGDASRGTPGVGLGLSLVQAVAKLHGSALELSDRHPGLCAMIAVPCNETASAVAGAAASSEVTVPGGAAGAPTATTAS
jgi:signal transduction histidine kinase